MPIGEKIITGQARCLLDMAFRNYDTFGVFSKAALIDPVQVLMENHWKVVNGKQCIQHDKLRAEIGRAFKEIIGEFTVPSVSSQTSDMQSVILNGSKQQASATDNFYRREHAKLFSEYAIMQLCSSIGISDKEGLEKKYRALARAEKVLVGARILKEKPAAQQTEQTHSNANANANAQKTKTQSRGQGTVVPVATQMSTATQQSVIDLVKSYPVS